MKAKYLIALLAVVAMVSATAADNPVENINIVVNNFKSVFCNMVPIAIMLGIAASAVIYAAGQMLGAEQRAKTASWAASLMTFSVVAGIIYVLVPWIIIKIAGEGSTLASNLNCHQ